MTSLMYTPFYNLSFFVGSQLGSPFFCLPAFPFSFYFNKVSYHQTVHQTVLQFTVGVTVLSEDHIRFH